MIIAASSLFLAVIMIGFALSPMNNDGVFIMSEVVCLRIKKNLSISAF